MNDALLEAESLVKDFAPRGLRLRGREPFRAVDDVTLSVCAGETLAIVGESGSGKSTTARLIARLLDPTSGRIRLEGEDITQAQGAQLAHLRRTVQFVFQDPYSSLNPRHDIERIVSAPLRYQGLRSDTSHTQRVAELLERVGLKPEHARRYPHQFSGGQAQRIGIARALAVAPKVVICDEAVSALDVSVQAQVLNLLHDLKERRGLTMVFISHDLAVVRNVCDRVAVMYLGKVVEETTVDALFAQPYHPYTSALLEAVPEPDPTLPVLPLELYGEAPSPLDPPSGCRFRTRCRHAQDICATEEPPLLTVADQHKVACHFAEDMPELLALPTMTA